MSASSDEDGSSLSSLSSDDFFSAEDGDDNALYPSATSFDDPFSDQSSTPTAGAAAVASIPALSPVPKMALMETPTPSASPNPLESAMCAGEVNPEPRISSERSRDELDDLASPSSTDACRDAISRLTEASNCVLGREKLPTSAPPNLLESSMRASKVNPEPRASSERSRGERDDLASPSSTDPCRDAISSLTEASKCVLGRRKLPNSITRPTSRPPAKGVLDRHTRRRPSELSSSITDDAVTDGHPSNIIEALKMLLPMKEPSRVYENADILDIAKGKKMDINLTPSWWRPGGYDDEIPKSQKEQSEKPS